VLRFHLFQDIRHTKPPERLDLALAHVDVNTDGGLANDRLISKAVSCCISVSSSPLLVQFRTDCCLSFENSHAVASNTFFYPAQLVLTAWKDWVQFRNVPFAVSPCSGGPVLDIRRPELEADTLI
jgi:hypothetical protein